MRQKKQVKSVIVVDRLWQLLAAFANGGSDHVASTEVFVLRDIGQNDCFQLRYRRKHSQ